MASTNAVSDPPFHSTNAVSDLPERSVLNASREFVADTRVDNTRAAVFPEDDFGLREEVKSILEAHPIGLSPEGHYLPESELQRIFKDTTAILCAIGGSIDQTLFDFVLENKRTFTTLLLVFSHCTDRKKALEGFQRSNFTDTTLYSATGASSAVLSLCEQVPCKYRNGECSHHFPLHNPWDSTLLDNLKSERWHFKVHTFDDNHFQFEIDINQLLPFKKKGPSGVLGDGNFSEVTRVKMLADPQNKLGVSDNTIDVALKTLKRLDNPIYDIDEEWRREAKAHMQLNNKNDHLIRAFAAYRQVATDRQNDRYHLVLEWADGGNLLSFWDQNRNPQVGDDVKQSRERVMDVLEQLRGLADALVEMHATPDESPNRRNSDLGSPRLSPARGLSVTEASLGPTPTSAVEADPPSFNFRVTEDPGEVGGNVPSVSVSPPESDGLSRLSSNSNSPTWRHGDIKPANILRFTGGNKDAWIGTLKLADLGRARQHLVRTQWRKTQEREFWRTIWYEPPDLTREKRRQAQGKISRLFDIWSVGCVIFETILWLLYGYDSIKAFQDASGLATNTEGATPYWYKDSSGTYVVSKTVANWMDYILEHDPERNSAIGDLVRLVQKRLLKIDLPPDSDKYTEGCRTNAMDMWKQLDQIIQTAEKNETYKYSGAVRSNISLPQNAELSTAQRLQTGSSLHLSPDVAQAQSARGVHGPATAIKINRGYSGSLRNQWNSFEDESARSMIDNSQLPMAKRIELCEACKNINLLSEQLSFAANTLKSNDKEGDCDLCDVVYKAIKQAGIELGDRVLLIRSTDSFVHAGTEEKPQKVLRLTRAELGKCR